MSPSVVIDSIDIPTCFYAHATSWTPGRYAIHFWNIDKSSGVELESRLSAKCFKMYSRVRVEELAKLLHWLLAGIQRYAGWICIHDKAMIWVWLFRTERELFVDWYAWVWFNCAKWNVGLIDRLMQISVQCSSGALECWSTANIEVTVDKC